MRAIGLVLLTACAGGEDVEIRFEAKFAGEAFRCDATYADVGLGASTVRPLDLRMFVHDVRLLMEDGESVEVKLADEGNQGQGLVLLDFEDNSGSCETGSESTWTSIIGTAPGADQAVGVAWKVGVPEDLNHLDAATAETPLNEPGMWWSWAGGFKYLKLDVATDTVESFFFHLGATSCDGTPGSGFSCAAGHVAEVQVDGWSPESVVVVDVADIFTGVNVDGPPPEGDELPGCMSFPGDAECGPMMEPLGIEFETDGALEQSVFSVVAP